MYPASFFLPSASSGAELRARIDSLGGEPVGNTLQEFAAIIRADIAKWRRVVAAANIKAK